MARERKGQSFDTSTRGSEFSYRTEEPPTRKDGNLFVWTVVILLLIGFAICCWVFSFYVFGHPEKPFSYSILAKLKKLDVPKRFEITAAPQGEFLNAQQLWDRYNKMTDRELDRASETLLRNYLRNYRLTSDKVPYIVGSYNILDSYELTDSNLFPSGVVALAQATDAPQVVLEHVFTADKRVIPVLHRMLLTGLNLRFDKTVDLSALVNVARLKDGRLQFTAIPLLYGSYTTSTGAGTFSLEPPSRLNIAAGLPVVSPTFDSRCDGETGYTPEPRRPQPHGNQFRCVASANATCSRRATKAGYRDGGSPRPRAVAYSAPCGRPGSSRNPGQIPCVDASFGGRVSRCQTNSASDNTAPASTLRFTNSGVHCNHRWRQVAHVCAGPDASRTTRERAGHA